MININFILLNIKNRIIYFTRLLFNKCHGRKIKKCQTIFNNINILSLESKIKHLKTDGYTIIKDFCNKDFIDNIEIEVKSATKTISKGVTKDKDYLIEVSKLSQSQLLLDHAYNLQMNESIRYIAYRYLGIGYFPRYAEFWFTPRSIANNNYKGSQLWHLDHEAKRQLKAFILISEKSTSDSLTQIITQKQTKAIKKTLRENLKLKKHIDNSNLDEYRENLRINRGDLLLVDTSNCFHRGGRITTQERIVFTSQYIPISSKISHLRRE